MACHSEVPNTLGWDLSCGMNRCAHSGSRAPAVRGLADEWGQTNKSFVCPHSSAILEVNDPARVFRPLCRVSAFQRPPMSKIGHVHWQLPPRKFGAHCDHEPGGSWKAEWSERSERNAVEESLKQSRARDGLRDCLS